MATRLYGIRVGEGEFAITEGAGSAVASDQIEITIELATTAIVSRDSAGSATTRGILKQEALEAIDKIKNHILKGNWPPA